MNDDPITKPTYSDAQTLVALGDFVEKRGLFRRRRGCVTYVPGISPPNPEMEFNGLTSVGIQFEDDAMIATIVDPDTGSLKKSIHFLGRGKSPELQRIRCI